MGIGHLSLQNKSAKNNWGLSLVGIRVIPTNPFSPHANPILGTNGGMNNIGVGGLQMMSGVLWLMLRWLWAESSGSPLSTLSNQPPFLPGSAVWKSSNRITQKGEIENLEDQGRPETSKL